jgi:NAD(P)H-hydrate epimerase
MAQRKNDLGSLPPSHPVLTCAEAKAWEQRILPDESHEWTAMQAAGTKLALSVLDDYREIGGLPPAARLLVLAGKGHNGGDALLAAKTILEKLPAASADVLLSFGETALRPLARRSLDVLRQAAGSRMREMSLSQLKTEFASYDLCLDGVFGFQFHPPMDDAIAGVLAWVNTHPRIRFRAAVDLPSGLGEASAGTVFRADFTYATGIVKSPVLNPANTALVGRLRYIDLGFFGDAAGLDEPGPGSTTPVTGRVLLPAILAPLAELRPAQSDKRTFGHLFVVGGSHSYPGAVLLAVRAALRSGVGLVTAFVPEKFAPEYAARHPEAMWVGCPVGVSGGLTAGTLELLRSRIGRATALLIGPGLAAGPETVALVEKIVRKAAVPLVLDADALRPEVIAAAAGKPFIVTPHAGEFQRIAGGAGLREFCKATGAVVVLKGPVTQIASRAGLRPAEDSQSKTGPTIFYSLFGGPVLARGGSGDILAGLIGGLLAQKPDDPLLAACRGVVWHGRAADLLARTHGQVTVETSELLGQLGPAVRPQPP